MKRLMALMMALALAMGGAALAEDGMAELRDIRRSVEDGNMDEERRLFYVAVTRAKDRLYLCVPRSKKTSDGGMYPVEPSQFVREIPPELYNEHEVRSVSPAYERPSARGDRWGGWGGGSRNRPENSWRTTWRR